jgi:transcriptional regulator with XRE-family HTH domain
VPRHDPLHVTRQLPERWRDLGTFIRDQRSHARLSLRRLSELAGVSNPYLSQIERGLRRPSAEILQQIAKALQISAETLYVQAGILEPDTGAPDLSRHILSDPHLTEDQKQALVRIYLSFRNENEPLKGSEPEGGSDWEAAADSTPEPDVAPEAQHEDPAEVTAANGASITADAP